MKKRTAISGRGVGWLLRHWEWALALCLAGCAWAVHRHYGMAWDDAQHAVYGSYVLDYFLSGFKDMRWHTDIGGLYNYGTIFDLPSAALHRALGNNLFLLRSFLMALTGVLAIPAVAGIGRMIGGNRLAIFSAASLLLMPQFVGQSFINCKDIPLATAISWSVLAILWAARKPGFVSFLVCGLLFGITLSVRIGGIMVFVFAGAVVGFLLLRSLVNRTLVPDCLWALKKRLPLYGLMAVAIAWGLMVSLWPFAHQSPFRNPIEAFTQSTAFPISYPVLYFGKVIGSDSLPWHYLPVMLALTMPLLLLGLSATGLLALAWQLLRDWRKPSSEYVFLILFWLLFPVFYVIARHPNIYDGIRHFLFLLPPLAVMAGIAAAKISVLIDRKWQDVGTILMAVALACTAPALFSMHPYQYAFYNILAGEKQTLHERFETDYWLTSYREAAGILNRQQAASARPLKVAVGANGLSIPCFTSFSDPRIEVAYFLGQSGAEPFPKSLDYTATVPRYGMWTNFPDAPVFAEIRRNGVLLCVIRQRPSPVPGTP